MTPLMAWCSGAGYSPPLAPSGLELDAELVMALLIPMVVAAAGLGSVAKGDADASCGADGGVMTGQETTSLLLPAGMASPAWLAWAIVEMVFSMVGSVLSSRVDPLLVFGVGDSVRFATAHGFDFAGAAAIRNVLFVAADGCGELVAPEETSDFCDASGFLGGDGVGRNIFQVGWHLLSVVISRCFRVFE